MENSFDRSAVRLMSALLLALTSPTIAGAQGSNNHHVLTHANWTNELNLQIPYEQFSICAGDNAVLTATSGHVFPETLWYDAPKGGKLLHTGSTFKVSPAETTVYYAASELYTEERGRDAITVTVSACQRRQAIGDDLGFIDVPAKAVKLQLSASTETGELLLRGKENWNGSLLTVQNSKGKEMQREVLKNDHFRLSGQYGGGVYIVNVTTPGGKTLIGKVRLYQ